MEAFGVFAVKYARFDREPNFSLIKKGFSLNPFTQSRYSEIVGEYKEGQVYFEIRENMIPSATQVLGILVIVIMGFASLESGDWNELISLFQFFLVLNVILYTHVKFEISYLEAKLKELLNQE